MRRTPYRRPQSPACFLSLRSSRHPSIRTGSSFSSTCLIDSLMFFAQDDMSVSSSIRLMFASVSCCLSSITRATIALPSGDSSSTSISDSSILIVLGSSIGCIATVLLLFSRLLILNLKSGLKFLIPGPLIVPR